MTEHHDHGEHYHDHHAHDHGAHDHGAADQQHAHHHEPAPGATELVHCPVMPDNLVNSDEAESKGLYRDYQGKRYWFCCAACGPLWDADPARYATAA